MGRKRTTPELQKLKAFDDSPELTDTKATSSQKMNTIKGLAKSRNSPQIVTRARGRRAPANVGLIHVPEMNDTPIAIEDGLQKDASVLSPKMFYSKRCQRSRRSAKLAENNEQNCIPAVKKSKQTVREKKAKSKSDSNNCPEPNSSDDKNNFPVILPKKFYRKAKQQSYINKKNIENNISASSAPPEPLTVLKNPNRIRAARIKNKAHMTTEEVITELTNDAAPVKYILLPMTEKVDIANKVNLRRRRREDVDKSISVKISKTVKPANNIGNKKRKVHLSLADIVKEVSPDSPEKKPPESKVISDISKSAVSLQKGSTTKQKAIKKGPPKKVSDNANRLNDEWDHSLLLITDDFNDSGNIYDFEEFQIGAKTSSANKSSFRKFDKTKSIKKAAAMKAVFNKRKVNKELATQRKIKKSNTKTSKITATKKIARKKVSPPLTGGNNPAIGSPISELKVSPGGNNPAIGSPISELKVSPGGNNPAIGSPISELKVSPGGNPAIGSPTCVKNQLTGSVNCGISVCDNHFQTPSMQMMKEPVSITEFEKLKLTKHIEEKIVSKVNPGICLQASLASDWPQLPDLPSQQFTKLKRGAMEGPTAADNLPENKPKPMMIKTFNHSSLDISSINAESPANKPLPAKATDSKKLDPKLSEKLSADNRPIDLFIYPIALPTRKQVNGVKKSGKCKESKQTPVKKLMDFMYAGSVERYLKKPGEDANLTSPPPIMLPKFLRAETSTPNTMANCSSLPKSMCISPVKDFQSPASMRTYEHVSRRNSSSFLSIIKNGDIFTDEAKENSQQPKKKTEKAKAKKTEKAKAKTNEKAKAKKKNGYFKTNKTFDEWANRMSNEFDEIEHFELSIEN